MNTETKTFLILSPGFPKDENDTACLPAQQNIVRSLNKQFPEIKIIIIAFQYPFFNSTYDWFGNTVIAFNGQNKSKLFRLLLWFKIWRKLKAIQNQNSIIGVLSFWCGECAMLGSQFGKKYTITHRSWILGQDAKKSNRYIKWIKPNADGLIALSDFVADEFENNFSIRPAKILPIGIDQTQYGILRERDIDIIAVGSLTLLKNYAVFLEVVAKLNEKIPELKVILIGNGPEAEKIQSLVKKYELEEVINISPAIPYLEVLQLMQRSKILLHPSSYEGFGMVNIEALYAGAAVISFIKPMHAEIKNWHIVNTTEEMIDKSIEILRDENFQYERVAPYLIADTAKTLMSFFPKQ